MIATAHCAIAEGLTGYYYQRAKKSGPVVVGPPDQVVVDKTINFATNTWNWRPFGWQEHFSVYWTGWINISSGGSITFSTFSDDGSKVYIDDQNIVENNRGRQEPSWSSGTANLSPGYHKIEITYYNWKGSGGMGLYWDTGAGAQIVPTDVLFPETFQPQ
ncbi:MAG: PA14 domain-containing protein [Nitrospirota bacterium]|nr:PA14 domain-containing protein [Nitrospirota bacterium]